MHHLHRSWHGETAETDSCRVGTGVAVSCGAAVLGDSDRFSSIADPAGDQFLIFDNLSV
ncbi:hypothetical protein JXA47_17840 [Candidatus Sumerlaeota bacterium]|nr:hypothetical protein [Candidatus Sumerlaeota bacterium]